MKIKATFFRKNLYQLLDSVLEGETIEIERKGKTIVIMEKKRKDIYEIIDERNSTISEPATEYNTETLSGIDKNWEEGWDKQWDEWLQEK